MSHNTELSEQRQAPRTTNYIPLKKQRVQGPDDKCLGICPVQNPCSITEALDPDAKLPIDHST